jgi:hypothetical protein
MGQIYWDANWLNDHHEYLSSALDATPSNLLSKISGSEFPALPPTPIFPAGGDGQWSLGSYSQHGVVKSIYYWKTKSTPTYYPNSPISTGLQGTITAQRVWLKVPIATHDQKFQCFRQKTKSTFDDDAWVTTHEFISTETITMVIPALQTYSAPIDFQPIPAIVQGYSMSSDVSDTLQSPERAPEVLTVNSDFDEGRIDPTIGYAIPDCDDMPSVDPETGAGNTKLELGAARNHLDGAFTKGELVIKDLHKGVV